MVNIQANDGKRKLKVREGSEFYVIFNSKTKVPKDAALYNGHQNKGQVKWEIANDPEENKDSMEVYLVDINTGIWTPIYFPQQELMNKYAGQVFGSSKLGWLNCDILYGIPNKTSLMISTNFSNSPEVYFITQISKVIIPAENTKDGRKLLYNIPERQSGHIVTIFKDKATQKEYFNLIPFTTGSKKEISISLVEFSSVDIAKRLSTLN
jgi:hypothetical protein